MVKILKDKEDNKYEIIELTDTENEKDLNDTNLSPNCRLKNSFNDKLYDSLDKIESDNVNINNNNGDNINNNNIKNNNNNNNGVINNNNNGDININYNYNNNDDDDDDDINDNNNNNNNDSNNNDNIHNNKNIELNSNFLESGRLVKLIAKLKKIAMERDILKKVSKKTNHRKKMKDKK